MLVLVIGDLHLPYRASDLPSKFRKLLVPGKIQQIVCTGNVCDRETLDYLRTVAGDVHVVRGDWDENVHFPSSLILHHPPLRIGVLHGHQIVPAGDTDSLCALARAMDVDVLLSGSTHKFDAFEREGRFFVNPGSATGAWSAIWPIRDPADIDSNEEAEEEEQDANEDKTGVEKKMGQQVEESGEKKDTEAKKGDKKSLDADAKPESAKNEASPSNKDAGKYEEAGNSTKLSIGGGKDEQNGNVNVLQKDPGGSSTEPKLAPGPVPSFAREYYQWIKELDRENEPF